MVEKRENLVQRGTMIGHIVVSEGNSCVLINGKWCDGKDTRSRERIRKGRVKCKKNMDIRILSIVIYDGIMHRICSD